MKIRPKGNAPIEVFPFVLLSRCEVILRHHDGESQDIELSPREARRTARALLDAAFEAEKLSKARAIKVPRELLKRPGKR